MTVRQLWLRRRNSNRTSYSWILACQRWTATRQLNCCGQGRGDRTCFWWRLLAGELRTTYAALRSGGDLSTVEHLYVDRVDLCLYGNTLPFRVRIVNRLNENFDYFYVKRADASRVYGLELEHVLSPNAVHFLARVDALNPMPTLVFLDIHMEPHNGFEMLAMLRQLPKYDTVPVVAMTASVMNEEIEQLRTAGFNGCIGKPIDIDTFPDAIQRILNGEVLWRIVN